MMLIDTGPLVAMFNPRESRHLECVEVWRKNPGIYTTTTACVTEALYFLGESAGFPGQAKLISLIQAGAIELFEILHSHYGRIKELMNKFSDLPMDFADASLVLAAENLGTNKVFTLDSDFAVYRIHEKEAFEIIP